MEFCCLVSILSWHWYITTQFLGLSLYINLPLIEVIEKRGRTGPHTHKKLTTATKPTGFLQEAHTTVTVHLSLSSHSFWQRN